MTVRMNPNIQMKSTQVTMPNTQTVMVVKPHGGFEALKTEMPVCPDRGAVIKLLAAGLCGSDVEKLARANDIAGTVLGHEIVGEIAASDHPDWPVGTRLVTSHHVPCLQCQYCLNGDESMCRVFKASNFNPGGFAPYFAITEGHLNHTAIKANPNIPLPALTAIEPLACVLKAIRRGGHIAGKAKVVIVGLGFIGLLAAMVYRHQYGESIDIAGVEKSEARLAQLKALGLDQYFTNLMTSEQFEESEPTGADSVFCSVLTPAIAEHAIRHVRDGGVILQFSRGMGQIPTTFDANALYYREISVLPSYSPNLDDLHKAGEMINQQTIDVKSLYTHQMSLMDINNGVDIYRSGEAIKVLLIP